MAAPNCNQCDNFVTKIKYGFGDKNFCGKDCKDKYLGLRARNMMTDEQKQFFNELNL